MKCPSKQYPECFNGCPERPVCWDYKNSMTTEKEGARYVCKKDNPWTPGKGRSEHPDAVYLKDKDYGDGECCACYRCPNCGLYFEEELAQ